MATLEQLIGLVETTMQGNAPADDSETTAHINQGYAEIAGGMMSTLGSFITPPLPNLFTIGTVTTSTSLPYVPMPVDFHRNLQFACNSNGIEIDIANSLIEFTVDYPLLNKRGQVTDVAEQGGNLYYQGIPTAETVITVHYYKAQTPLALASSVPSAIPAHLQIPLLVNYACREIWKIIEDGIDGGVINTTKHNSLFTAALRTLELSIPYDTRSLFMGA